MAHGKWISDLDAGTALTDAARRVLTVRLEVVRDYLPLAVHQPDKDPEHVHQLRVGTRRAGAALDIFALCLPRKVYRSTRKRIRNIRRTAGEARDWDVFLLELASRRPRTEKQQPGLDFLIGYAEAHRMMAQTHLEDSTAKYPFDYDRFIAETVAGVHKPQADHLHTLGDLARPWLTGLLQELAQAEARDLNDYANLHQVRIAGKRLRYAMEVFADCFAAPFRDELYPAVEEMQEILGCANDSHVALGRLEAIRARMRVTRPADWKRLHTGVDSLLRYHKQRLPRQRQAFQEWWLRWQDSGAEALLTNLLLVQSSAPVPR
jgi:CHAD domain-containing protein